MVKRYKGNHSIITWEDQYYDGFELDYYDERDVSLDKDIEEIDYTYMDVEVIWLKNEAQKKYYRKPFESESSKENRVVFNK
ncbi:hypothetical protein IAQ67_16640 [Paenibacillus peoriae]|uniref:Uncharacterized protein n=1 Tax=Paenibacillus peoriae TaxID=59893 RepID=A0A7H0Y355_9BACL|nr:hypothetical protein [Paenibacillus peoriae]QNR65513.1 hypothetical protein IAQ67_16640 [Paenibacillus peoriae]